MESLLIGLLLGCIFFIILEAVVRKKNQRDLDNLFMSMIIETTMRVMEAEKEAESYIKNKKREIDEIVNKAGKK